MDDIVVIRHDAVIIMFVVRNIIWSKTGSLGRKMKHWMASLKHNEVVFSIVVFACVMPTSNRIGIAGITIKTLSHLLNCRITIAVFVLNQNLYIIR